MKIESKEKIKNLFCWKLFGILYLASLAFSFVRIFVLMREGTLDWLSAIFQSIINSLPFFAYSLIICGIIGMITMIALKAGKMKLLLSISMMLVGVLALALCVYWTIGWIALLSFFDVFFYTDTMLIAYRHTINSKTIGIVNTAFEVLVG